MTAIVCTAIICGSALVGWLAYLRQRPSADRMTALESEVQRIKTALTIRQEVGRR